MAEAIGVESSSNASDYTSKLEEQNQGLVNQIADLSTGRIPVGGPGENATSKALSVDPEKDNFQANKDILRSQVQNKHQEYENKYLAEKQGGEMAEAIGDAENNSSVYRDKFEHAKQISAAAMRVRNNEDYQEFQQARGRREELKGLMKEEYGKGEKLSNLRTKVETQGSQELSREDLEILDDQELSEAMIESVEKLNEAEVKLQNEIREKQAQLKRVGVQKVLLKSYGKVLNALQGVNIFGIANAARRAALNTNLPQEKNDGGEYWARQGVKENTTDVENSLGEVQRSVEDAILVNQDAMESMEGEFGEVEGKSKLINLILSRRDRFVSKNQEIRYAKQAMQSKIAKEEEILGGKLSEISDKGMAEYTGKSDYDQFAKATEDSVVAVNSQDFNIAHKQAVIGSNESNLKGLTAQTIGEMAQSGDSRANVEIEKALSRIDEQRVARGQAPMTEDERQVQTGRLTEV